MSVDKFGRHSSGQIYMEPGVSVRYVNYNFVRRNGSNDVGGDISMNNHKLVNLSEPMEAQDAATRGYIKNFTRNNFLKIDGTNNMEGDLNADNHKIINLSDPVDDGDVINKISFRRDGGDLNLNNNKIVNLSEPNSDQDAATKQYVYSRKPLITIWAQENGLLNGGEYEWSFGSGDLYTLAKCGYCMPAAGRILRGSLSSVTDSPNSGLSHPAMVEIAINGQRTRKAITKNHTDYSNTTVFSPSIEVAQNDRINFRTAVDTANAVNNIVSLLIELDL